MRPEGPMKKKIKILQLCAVDFTAEKILMPLVTKLQTEFDVTLVCSNGDYCDMIRQRGINLHNIEIDRKVSLIKNIKTIYSLYKFMKQEKFDVLETHTPIASILGRIAAKLAGVPIVIYKVHGYYFHEHMSSVRRQSHILIEKFCALFTDYIFTVSQEDKQSTIQLRIKKEDRVFYVGNGIDTSRFSLENVTSEIVMEQKSKLNYKETDIIIGIVARIVKEKGYYEFIEAANIICKKFNNVHFVIVGETLASDYDGIKQMLLEMIERFELQDKIKFLGNRDDIPELLGIMDIFTLPSHREGLPLSLLEAMSMSKPVVATNIRGSREEVIPNEHGYLVEVGDYIGLADKLTQLIENKSLRTNMGRNGRERVLNHYEMNDILNHEMELIHAICTDNIISRREFFLIR
jgi:glycosyltransferase involved in cell wall biosynthesis